MRDRIIKFLASGNWSNSSAVEGSGGKESIAWNWESDFHTSDYSFLESLLRNTQVLFRSSSIISVWVKNNTVKSKQEDLFPGQEEANVDRAWKIDWEYLAEHHICATISLKLIHLMLSTLGEAQTFLQANMPSLYYYDLFLWATSLPEDTKLT